MRGDIKKINDNIYPEFNEVLNKKKVNVDDLKGWLAETIDKRVSDKADEIDKKYDEKYKSIILKQKTEIQDLKKALQTAQVSGSAALNVNTGSTGDKPVRATMKQPPSENFTEVEERKSALGQAKQRLESSQQPAASNQTEFQENLE